MNVWLWFLSGLAIAEFMALCYLVRVRTVARQSEDTAKLLTEAYIRGLSDAGSTLRVYGETEGLKRIVNAIDQVSKGVKPTHVDIPR